MMVFVRNMIIINFTTIFVIMGLDIELWILSISPIASLCAVLSIRCKELLQLALQLEAQPTQPTISSHSWYRNHYIHHWIPISLRQLVWRAVFLQGNKEYSIWLRTNKSIVISILFKYYSNLTMLGSRSHKSRQHNSI